MGNDFKEEFIEKYNSEEYEEVEKLIDVLFDQSGGCSEGEIWEASVCIEK